MIKRIVTSLLVLIALSAPVVSTPTAVNWNSGPAKIAANWNSGPASPNVNWNS